MRSAKNETYRRAVHGSFPHDNRRAASDVLDDPNLTDREHSQAAVLRELGWTVVGCAAVIVMVNILAVLLGTH